MTNNIEQNQWDQVKGNLQEFFSKLTDDDLTLIEGYDDTLFKVLHERYGYSEEQAQDQWDKFIHRYDRAART